MASIANLTETDTFTNSNLLAMSDGNNDRKIVGSNFLKWIEGALNLDNKKDSFTTQYSSPNTTGLNITVNDGDTPNNTNAWLIITPNDNYEDLTITLPLYSDLADKQEILVVITKSITNLIIDINGASGIVGVPSSLNANDVFRLKYDKPFKTWYTVSKINLFESAGLASFHVESNSEFTISSDLANPSKINGLIQINGINGFELDDTTQSLKNISGVNLSMSGTLSIQVSHTGAQPVELYVYSEKSIDGGTTWNKLSGSLRENSITKDGIDYRTYSSKTDNPWEDQALIRFGFVTQGTGSAEFALPSLEIEGDLISGHTFSWTMTVRDE